MVWKNALLLLISAFVGGISAVAQIENAPLVRPAIFEGFVYSNVSSNNTDDWIGMDVDIIKYICNLTTSDGAPSWVGPGIEPFLPCTPLDEALITTNLDDRLAVVINGEADFSIGAISWTPERENLVDFIRPFYYSTGSVLLGTGSSIEWRDLNGQNLCTYPNYHASKALQNVYGVKGYVDVSGQSEAAARIQNGECIAMLVDEQGDPTNGILKVVSNETAEIGASPYGIVVRKNAPADLVHSLTAAAVSMLWSGRSSPIWGIANNTFKPRDGGESFMDVSRTLEFPTSAITGFLTQNGNALDWSTAPVVNGSRSVPSAETHPPVNATIVVYKGNALPLASIEGNIPFLEDGSLWKGIEIEMLKVICSSSIIKCTGVVVAGTVDERLSILVDGKADISIGSIVVNQERLQQAYFVQPYYFSAGPALYVPVNQSSTVPKDVTLEYMNGKDVCTVTDSAQNPAGEKYGANLISFGTRVEAEAAIYKGECIGLLWVSHVQFDGLVEVATDTSMDDPIGIAVSPDLPVRAYSYLSSLSSQFMSKGASSDLLKWEEKFKGSASPNPILFAVTDAITNFEPSSLTSAAIQDSDFIEAVDESDISAAYTLCSRCFLGFIVRCLFVLLSLVN